MLEKFYVLVLSINKSGGNSEEISRHDTYEAAESKYFDKCSNYAGNAQTGYVVIQLLDGYGRAMNGKTTTINRLPQPTPPEPETEE